MKSLTFGSVLLLLLACSSQKNQNDEAKVHTRAKPTFAKVQEPSIPRPREPFKLASEGTLQSYSLVAGTLHNCALRKGKVYCWGSNRFGQLGVGKAGEGNQSSVPTKVSLPVKVQRLFAGYWNTCALSAEGELFCWGYNAYGQLSKPGQSESSLVGHQDIYLPKKVADKVIDVAMGRESLCFKNDKMLLTCRGGSEPEQDISGVEAKRFALSADFSCWIDLTGKLFCSGYLPTGKTGNKVLMAEAAEDLSCRGQRCCFANESDISCFGQDKGRSLVKRIKLRSPTSIGSWNTFALGSKTSLTNHEQTLSLRGQINKRERLEDEPAEFVGPIEVAACGVGHCCFQAGEKVYCSGRMREGQTCVGTEERPKAPTECVFGDDTTTGKAVGE